MPRRLIWLREEHPVVSADADATNGFTARAATRDGFVALSGTGTIPKITPEPWVVHCARVYVKHDIAGGSYHVKSGVFGAFVVPQDVEGRFCPVHVGPVENVLGLVLPRPVFTDRGFGWSFNVLAVAETDIVAFVLGYEVVHG